VTGRSTTRSLTGVALATLLATLALCLPPARAAGPPQVEEAWATDVFSTSARLHASINPNDDVTVFRVEYITEAAYQANLADSDPGFQGAARSPTGSDASVGSGSGTVDVVRIVSGLAPATAYRYRVVATNGSGPTTLELNPAGAPLAVTTHPQSASGPDPCANATAREQTGARNAGLPDCRAFEMVSPPDKNGGQVDPLGALAGGGVLQAGSGGGTVTYGSAASFGSGAEGAPPASQYIASRGSGGWSSENVTVPIFAGSFGIGEEGVSYRLFSSDLSRGLLLSGRHCRGEEVGCPVANPPLAGTDAPAGYQNYYLRTDTGYAATIGASDVVHTGVEPGDFSVSFAGASADLSRVALSTCAALTAAATEVPDVSGCDPAQPNLYLHSGGSLTLVNPAPPATLAASAGAVSADGARVYWTDGVDLYLHDGGATKQVDADAGGGGTFEAAATDGSVAYFTAAADLWRYTAAGDAATAIASGVTGVLGASADGAVVYYQDAAGIQRWRSGATRQVASGVAAADPSSFPPATGTARVSADGARLLIVSSEPLTGYDNTDLGTGLPDSQVFLYDDSGAGSLTCVSCKPSGGRPSGPSSLPGASANGTGPEATVARKPRVLAAGGERVYFSTRDGLALTDTNNDADVYQWQAQGKGDCVRPGGCLALISSGRAAEGAIFVDASAGGEDVFFLTSRSLSPLDPGALDLYDARTGGGFALPTPPIACEGDACQSLPPEPEDPTLTTLLEGLGNPPIRYFGAVRNCRPFLANAKRLARRARGNSRRAKRLARRRGGAARARRLRRRAARFAKRSKKQRAALRKCRQINRQAIEAEGEGQ
jgi:hypothetical protein